MKYYYFPLTTALLLSYGEIINNLSPFKFKFWQQHKGVVFMNLRQKFTQTRQLCRRIKVTAEKKR